MPGVTWVPFNPGHVAVMDIKAQNYQAISKALDIGKMLEIQNAQASMEKIAEFKGTVKSVRTDVLVDKAAEQLYPKWRDNFEQWEKTGSDFGYHYMGSAIWFSRMGTAFAEAVLDLMK